MPADQINPVTIRFYALCIIVVVTTIASWIFRVRMQRRIRKALGTKVKSEAELTSLNTWMRVKEAEERNNIDGN
jgi:prolipoprotein diacylglyceryltransferase